MNTRVSLVAGLLAATLTGSNALAFERVQTRSGIEKIFATYNNSRLYMATAQEGEEVSLVCSELTFLDWYGLYSTVLTSLNSADRDEAEIKKFDSAAETVQSDINEVFEPGRPGISRAIRTQLREFRSGKDPKGPKAPDVPLSLTIDNPQELLFAQNLRFCENPALIDAVNVVVSLPDSNKQLVRTLVEQVPDLNSNFNGLYVPTHPEKRKKSMNYSSWIEYIKNRLFSSY